MTNNTKLLLAVLTLSASSITHYALGMNLTRPSEDTEFYDGNNTSLAPYRSDDLSEKSEIWNRDIFRPSPGVEDLPEDLEEDDQKPWQETATYGLMPKNHADIQEESPKKDLPEGYKSLKSEEDSWKSGLFDIFPKRVKKRRDSLKLISLADRDEDASVVPNKEDQTEDLYEGLDIDMSNLPSLDDRWGPQDLATYLEREKEARQRQKDYHALRLASLDETSTVAAADRYRNSQESIAQTREATEEADEGKQADDELSWVLIG